MNEYLKSFIDFKDKSPFYIKLAGITFPDPTYHITRANANVAVIEYVLEGEGYVTIDETTHPVCKNTIYFLPQGKRHDYFSSSEHPFKKIFLNVSGDFCNQLLLSYGLTGKYFFRNIKLRPVFEKIPAIIQSNRSEGEMQSALQGLFIEILSSLSIAQAESTADQEALKLKSYLDNNLHRMISTKEVADSIFRSQDYCQKLFLREFGTTPYAYQLEQKIQTAKTLLADTSLSIQEIGEKIGYPDSHYFSNLFLKKCGCRPSAYRKSKR